MNAGGKGSAFILGLAVFAGLAALGHLLGRAAIEVKGFERSVTVKGLAEREVPADIVIWPIVFTEAGNDLEGLYGSIEATTRRITDFLGASGVEAEAVSVSLPSVTDRSAQAYDGGQRAQFRYAAVQTVTVYSPKVEDLRSVMGRLAALGKDGIAFTGENYQAQTEYLFTGLNDVKPEMIEEATTKAREVARKFAQDSDSRLGKIKRASQGQFSIEARDKNNPHIKKIRVVTTVEYYLVD